MAQRGATRGVMHALLAVARTSGGIASVEVFGTSKAINTTPHTAWLRLASSSSTTPADKNVSAAAAVATTTQHAQHQGVRINTNSSRHASKHTPPLTHGPSTPPRTQQLWSHQPTSASEDENENVTKSIWFDRGSDTDPLPVAFMPLASLWAVDAEQLKAVGRKWRRSESGTTRDALLFTPIRVL